MNRFFFKYDFTEHIKLNYYYGKNLIEIHTFNKDSLVSIEKNYYKYNLLTSKKIFLTEGSLEKKDLLLNYKIIYNNKKQVIKFYTYSYDKGVKTCEYDQNGFYLNSNNTFKHWIMIKNNNGKKYPQIEKEICNSLNFIPHNRFRYKKVEP